MPLVKLPLLLLLLLPMVRRAAAACAGAAAAAAATDTVGEAGASSFGGRGDLVELDGRVRKWVAVVHLSFFGLYVCVWGRGEKLVMGSVRCSSDDVAWEGVYHPDRTSTTGST